MCRLLAVTRAETPLLKETLAHFENLAETGKVRIDSPPGHKDGWGLVGYQGGMPVIQEKEPSSAAGNPKFEATVQNIITATPELVVGHLRKAFVGSLSEENTQPYSAGNLAFCHNGTVHGFETLPLSEGSRKLRKGTSDSEWLFLRLRELFAENPAESFHKLVKEVRALNYSAFIVLFSDGKKLWALREVNEQEPSIQSEGALNSYYTLFLGTSASGATFICSELLEIPGISWTSIKNHELLTIELRTSDIVRALI